MMLEFPSNHYQKLFNRYFIYFIDIYSTDTDTDTPHPELARVRSIWFLLFEIKRVLVYNSVIFKLTDLFILYRKFCTEKKYLRKKAKKLMYKGLNCDRKSQLSEILTEPLNPRDLEQCAIHVTLYSVQST